MDLSIINLLFSAVFVLIGSLAFHISALVSGDDIYRDLPTQESALLSIVAGIVIFLLSPISFIIFSSSNACYVDTLVQILDFEILLAFFGCAFGLGLIFGSLSIVKARVAILDWFRDESGMKFWISSYGIACDDFLGGVKRKGEVFVQTDSGLFRGLLVAFSAKHEQREIVLGEYETIGTDGSEEDADVLIPGSEIKRIIIPRRSFKKHYETMGHISQAFYCQISAIGLLFLSGSAKLTGNYIQDNLNLIVDSLDSFYHTLSPSFSVLAIIVLCISVWVAEKDFDKFWSLLRLSPDIIFMALFFLLIAVLFIIFNMQISHIIIAHIIIFIFVFLLLYIYIIRNWLKKPIKGCFDDIKGDFKNYEKLLEEVIQKFYLRLRCNGKEKAHIKGIRCEILAECKSSHEVNKINCMIEKLDALKDDVKCLKNEDFNIILEFRKYIKKVKC